MIAAALLEPNGPGQEFHDGSVAYPETILLGSAQGSRDMPAKRSSAEI
jgi:hypothetical protein